MFSTATKWLEKRPTRAGKRTFLFALIILYPTREVLTKAEQEKSDRRESGQEKYANTRDDFSSVKYWR